MRTITVYEHMTLPLRGAGHDPDISLEPREFDALARYYGQEPRYFSLVHKGIKFTQWVGLFRVGDLQIEVLPKLARGNDRTDIPLWRNFLMDILVRAGLISYHKQPESITGTCHTMLDLMLWHYLAELKQALHRGLIKRYRRKEGNLYALKGKLLFGSHIRQNLVHQERFYTSHSIYDFDHALNQLLATALRLIPALTQSRLLRNGAEQLCLDMPLISEVGHPRGLVDRIKTDRKSAPFASLITLARLIIDNHHPALHTGQAETFSLMFDMNRVFEEWLCAELRSIPGVRVTRPRLGFIDFEGYRPRGGYPDLVVHYQGRCLVLDAKWKVIADIDDVADQDLRQIYTYLHLQPDGVGGGLVYPTIQGGVPLSVTKGRYGHRDHAHYRFPFQLGQVPVVRQTSSRREYKLVSLNSEGWFSTWVAKLDGVK